jgi:hypothetical protein
MTANRSLLASPNAPKMTIEAPRALVAVPSATKTPPAAALPHLSIWLDPTVLRLTKQSAAGHREIDSFSSVT